MTLKKIIKKNVLARGTLWGVAGFMRKKTWSGKNPSVHEVGQCCTTHPRTTEMQARNKKKLI